MHHLEGLVKRAQKNLTRLCCHAISFNDISIIDTANGDIMKKNDEKAKPAAPAEIDSILRRILPLTETTFYILISLMRPRHGYGIMRNAARISGEAVKLGPGTLYGALNTLLKQGLIERLGEREGEAGGDRRKIYGLTALGRRAVAVECERIEALAGHAREAMQDAGPGMDEGRENEGHEGEGR
jgi:DNA-binding PadR family transcriptional regulator